MIGSDQFSVLAVTDGHQTDAAWIKDGSTLMVNMTGVNGDTKFDSTGGFRTELRE